MVKGRMVDTPEDKPYVTSRPIPRRRLWRRLLLGGIAIIILVPVVAVTAAVLTFNPNAYKPPPRRPGGRSRSPGRSRSSFPSSRR
jgi:hypothetical protein